jgi:hypothetical protein
MTTDLGLAAIIAPFFSWINEISKRQLPAGYPCHGSYLSQ